MRFSHVSSEELCRARHSSYAFTFELLEKAGVGVALTTGCVLMASPACYPALLEDRELIGQSSALSKICAEIGRLTAWPHPRCPFSHILFTVKMLGQPW